MRRAITAPAEEPDLASSAPAATVPGFVVGPAAAAGVPAGASAPTGTPAGLPVGLPAAVPAAEPVSLRTEFAFELPRGYVDAWGTLHRTGTMRLATARDELFPLRDPRVKENPAYLTVVLLSRVVTRLGAITEITTGLVEELFASDVAFLQDLYRRINSEGHTRAAVVCPDCDHRFDVDLAGGRLGES